ncbi:MAG: hypothetical protein E7618_05460 [Ruminococcaceae bacterium]|nr:hypothetical protein [Oscillospiraceae bacterium]
MKICIFADPHYCSKETLGNSDRKPKLSLEKMTRMVAAAQAEGISLFVCLGDFVNMEGSREKDKQNAAEAAKVLTDSGIPCILCMGNHDGEVMTREEFAEVTGFLIAPCTYDLPSGKRLVFLDANYDSNYTPYQCHHVDWTDANVPPKELAWLREALAGREAEVFLHQNLEPEAEAHHRVRNYEDVLAILKENRVLRVWQGHYHYGADRVWENIPFITLKAMCVFEDTAVIAEV